jgi:hypothetical protein
MDVATARESRSETERERLRKVNMFARDALYSFLRCAGDLS